MKKNIEFVFGPVLHQLTVSPAGITLMIKRKQATCSVAVRDADTPTGVRGLHKFQTCLVEHWTAPTCRKLPTVQLRNGSNLSWTERKRSVTEAQSRDPYGWNEAMNRSGLQWILLTAACTLPLSNETDAIETDEQNSVKGNLKRVDLVEACRQSLAVLWCTGWHTPFRPITSHKHND